MRDGVERGVRSGVLCCLLLSTSIWVCGAQETVTPAPTLPEMEIPRREFSVPKPPQILCGTDQLEIRADDSTFSSILNLVGACIGVPVQLPAGFADERTYLKAGPGTPRDVLNTFLNSTDLNFVIKVSKSNPGKITGVILTDREQDATDGKESIGVDGLLMTPARRLWLAGREAARPAVAERPEARHSPSEPGGLAEPEGLPLRANEAATAAADTADTAQPGDGSAMMAAEAGAQHVVGVEDNKLHTDEGPLRTQINQMQQMFEERRKLNTLPSTSTAPH